MLSAVLTCAALFSSCSSDKKPESSYSVPDTTTAEITTDSSDSQTGTNNKKDFGISLNDIKQANGFNIVLNDTTTTYECDQTYYNDDGSQQSNIYTGVQISGDQYYYINDSSTGDVTYANTEKGKSYSKMFVNSFDVPYGVRFIDNQTVKKEIDEISDTHITFSEYENIIESVTEGDIITLTTETPVSEETRGDHTDFYSYANMDLFTKIKRTYEINADTKILIKSYAYGVLKSGEESMLKYTSMTYSNNVLKAPDFTDEINNMTDMRTINVIDENGNTQTYQLPKKVLFAYTAPNGYMMYTDKEGKEIFSNSDYLDKDADIYVLPIK